MGVSLLQAAFLIFNVVVQTPEQIQQGWEAFDGEGLAYGYTQLIYDGSKITCTIYVPPLTDETQWIWVHEIRHCKEGDFHR